MGFPLNFKLLSFTTQYRQVLYKESFVQDKAEKRTVSLHFEYLPAFASFIAQHHIRAYSNLQIRLSREMKVPVMKFLDGMSDDDLLALTMKSSTEFLHYLANNQAHQQIQESIKRWLSNQLPRVDKHEIAAEDITLLTYIRKQGLLQFLPAYTSTAGEMMELIKEIDYYCLQSETAATNTYINILKEKIEEHAYLLEKINNTVPGAVYVFDLVKFKGIYSNSNLDAVIGYHQEELNRMGKNVYEKIIHPDDVHRLLEDNASINKLQDRQIRTFKYRIKKKDGSYHWVRNYESVFKRDETGRVTQKIGITLNIDKEEQMSRELEQREKQLLEAQDIAQIGSYYWEFETKRSVQTPKTMQILELETDNNADFMARVHPADLPKMEAALERSKKTGLYECEYRYQGKDEWKVIHARGLVNYENGKAVSLTGTVMDVTERSNMLHALQQSRERYKQAEALTHIGNYEWDIATGLVEVSEEFCRIYGYDTSRRTISYHELVNRRSEENETEVDVELRKAIEEKKPFDFYYKIKAAGHSHKLLHVRGDVICDEKGNTTKLIGTAQDVTEKQKLIQQLRQSEQLYKQAEKLAKIGNYSWNIATNEIQWTDQLYIIYGLEPQSEKITLDRFVSFVHPDDRQHVKNGIRDFTNEKSIDYTFRIITGKNEVKTIRSIAQLLLDSKGNPTQVVGTEQDITENQLLIDNLERSEALYKQAQSIARLGNWSFNFIDGSAHWSEEMFRIYEIPADTKVNLELFYSFIHPDEKEEVINYLDECIREKHSYDKRHRIVLRNGKIKTLHRKGELRFGPAGDPIEMFGTTQDITEQQAIENALIENRTFIQKIADATPSIIASYNVNSGKYVFINQGIRKLLGYEPELVMEQGIAFFMDVVHPDDLRMISDKNSQIVAEYNLPQNRDNNNMIAEFVYRMRHRNGNYMWFRTYGTIFDRNSQGQIEHVLNISLNITEQVEAAEKIREQEHFINHIADASPTVLYLYNTKTASIEYINREIYYVLGYSIEEIVQAGADITKLLYHPDDYPLLPERRESSKKFRHTDSMMQYECRMKTKEGKWCWLLVREVIFKIDEHGEVVQILGAALDISKRKEMERTLIQNAHQLEQSNASLEEFAYVASHDLKEPLRKISTFGDRMLQTQQGKLSEDGSIYLKKIVDASQRMQTMINDLLSISMISGDKSFQPYSLKQVLDEVMQTLEYKIEHSNAVIKADELPEAQIIPSQFRQLFQNLLSNSLKFHRPDVQPVITIRHKLVEPYEVQHLQLAKAACYHRLQFIDNGIGFEDEYAGKIFAIFQRLHGRSEYEGTGIGLAICKKIVEHHGGAIYAYAEPDAGATFVIVFPA